MRIQLIRMRTFRYHLDWRSFAPAGNHQLQMTFGDTLSRRRRRVFWYFGECQLAATGRVTKSAFYTPIFRYPVKFARFPTLGPPYPLLRFFGTRPPYLSFWASNFRLQLQVFAIIPWVFGDVPAETLDSWVVVRIQAFASTAAFQTPARRVRIGEPVVGFSHPSPGVRNQLSWLVGCDTCSMMDWQLSSAHTLPPSPWGVNPDVLFASLKEISPLRNSPPCDFPAVGE